MPRQYKIARSLWLVAGGTAIAVAAIVMAIGPVSPFNHGVRGQSRSQTIAPARPVVRLAGPEPHAGGSGTVFAGECARPFPPRLLTAVASGHRLTVGVFGDSFGDGVWAALSRRLAKDKFSVLRLSLANTGFTRYDVNNVEQQAAARLSKEPVDIAVVVFGANDTQGIVDHGRARPFLSADWKVLYGARMAGLVSLLRSQGAMVYWIGLPKMRTSIYDQHIAALNTFSAQQMAALDVPYLSTEALSEDENGQFSRRLSDPTTRRPELMRAKDGIHMTPAGYRRLTDPLMDHVNACLDRARASAMFAAEPANSASGPPLTASERAG